MAEINMAGGNRHGGGLRRSKKLSTKVDLTPMVDLGFLLITFFVFTSSMTRPKSMKLYIPAGEKAVMPAGESTVLTVIPVSANRIFYYHGQLESALRNNQYGITSFSPHHGLRDIIQQKKLALAYHYRYRSNDLLLLIKPTDDARLQHVMAVLDEVLINDLRHYTLTAPDAAEIKVLANLGIR